MITIQDGIFQLIDPFSLIPYHSLQFPEHLCRDLTDYKLHQNLLFGFGLNHLLIYELDQEILKLRGESLFAHQEYSLYEEYRTSLVQPDLIVQKPSSFFKKMLHKYITVNSSLERHRERSLERKRSLGKSEERYKVVV